MEPPGSPLPVAKFLSQSEVEQQSNQPMMRSFMEYLSTQLDGYQQPYPTETLTSPGLSFVMVNPSEQSSQYKCNSGEGYTLNIIDDWTGHGAPPVPDFTLEPTTPLDSDKTNHDDQQIFTESNDIQQTVDDSSSWVFDLLQNLSGWLYSTQATLFNTLQETSSSDDQLSTPKKFDDVGTEGFWAEWEWVLSQTEKLAIHQSAQQANQIEQELRQLRLKANHLKQRPYFVDCAKQFLMLDHPQTNFSAEDLKVLESGKLSADLRSKLLREVVLHFADQWLSFISSTFFSLASDTSVETSSELSHDLTQSQLDIALNQFESQFHERPYAKNVVGALVSLSFVASHGADEKLTPAVLGEILWTWWSTLCNSIRESLQMPRISTAKAQALAERILQSGPMVASMWIQTLQNSFSSMHNEGNLPKLWREQEAKEQARLKKLKEEGVDARWGDGPKPSKKSLSKEKLAKFRDLLLTVFPPEQ